MSKIKKKEILQSHCQFFQKENTRKSRNENKQKKILEKKPRNQTNEIIKISTARSISGKKYETLKALDCACTYCSLP